MLTIYVNAPAVFPQDMAEHPGPQQTSLLKLRQRSKSKVSARHPFGRRGSSGPWRDFAIDS